MNKINIDKKLTMEKGLTFDDILLLPDYSEIRRSEVDLSTFFTPKIKLKIPLLSSPMDTVTNAEMAIALGKMGGLGVIHRSFTIEEHTREVKKVKREIEIAVSAVGVGQDFQERIKELAKSGIDAVVVDSAHGYSKSVIDAVKYITETFKKIEVIAGNVATKEGVEAVIKAGAAAVRVGMGPGSICTTRIVSGMGVPQVTAILNAVTVAQKYNIPVIADGGIRYSGDVVKAISCGANSVMIGSLFAGCKESPGKLIEKNGEKFKTYRGMGSVSAMKEGSSSRYGQEYRKNQKKKLFAEGVEGLIPYKGEVSDLVDQLTGGLRAGMYYVGATNIEELRLKTKFIQISTASLIESHPHDIDFSNK